MGERRRKLRWGGLALACSALVCLVLAFALPALSPSGTPSGGVSDPASQLPASDGGSGGPSSQSSAARGGSFSKNGGSDFETAGSGGAFQPEPEADPETLVWEDGGEYLPDEVLVELPDGLSAGGLNASLSEFPFVETSSVSEDDVAFGWLKLDLVAGTDVAQAIGRLEESGVVAGAQPNFVYHALEGVAGPRPSSTQTGVSQASATATSPAGESAAGTQAPGGPAASADKHAALALGTLATESSEGDVWHLKAVHATEAWNLRKTSKKVTVAIIDSGCDVSHPDLKANVVDSRDVLTGKKRVTDQTGHGTHVAGIVAGVAGNGTGVAGVSYNAGIMPIKVMKGNTADTAALVKAYKYIMENAKRYNVRVVNVSLGSERRSLDATDQAITRAIDSAHRAGILSVIAAGNDGSKAPYYCFPCDYAENSVGVVSVGEDYAAGKDVYDNGLPDPSSNYNKGREKTKDISAPGVCIESTAPGGGYDLMTGTSMAAPVVSGVAALVFAQNPALDAGAAKSVLCSSAQDLVHRTGSKTANVGFDAYTGYGMVRADQAVKGAASGYIAGAGSVVKGGRIALSVPRKGAWKWASSDPAIAKVDASTGMVSGVGHGEVVISAKQGTTTLYRTVVVYDVSLSAPKTVVVGKKNALVADASPVSTWSFSSSNPKVASVGALTGVMKGLKAGKVTITATLNADPSIKLTKKVRIVKKNPLSVKAKTKRVKYTRLKSKSVKVKAIVIKKKGKGKMSFAKIAEGSSTRLSVNRKTGKVKVKKGTVRGVYLMSVRVKAAGNAKYQSASKVVKVKVVVE